MGAWFYNVGPACPTNRMISRSWVPRTYTIGWFRQHFCGSFSSSDAPHSHSMNSLPPREKVFLNGIALDTSLPLPATQGCVSTPDCPRTSSWLLRSMLWSTAQDSLVMCRERGIGNRLAWVLAGRGCRTPQISAPPYSSFRVTFDTFIITYHDWRSSNWRGECVWEAVWLRLELGFDDRPINVLEVGQLLEAVVFRILLQDFVERVSNKYNVFEFRKLFDPVQLLPGLDPIV